MLSKKLEGWLFKTLTKAFYKLGNALVGLSFTVLVRSSFSFDSCEDFEQSEV